MNGMDKRLRIIYILALVISTLIATAVLLAQTPVAITNPNFLSDISGWSYYGNCTVFQWYSNQNFDVGSLGMKAGSSSTCYGFQDLGSLPSPSPGEVFTYTLLGWYRGASGLGSFGLLLGGEDTASASWCACIDGNNWASCTHTVVITGSNPYTGVVLLRDAGANNWTYVDNITLTYHVGGATYTPTPTNTPTPTPTPTDTPTPTPTPTNTPTDTPTPTPTPTGVPTDTPTPTNTPTSEPTNTPTVTPTPTITPTSWPIPTLIPPITDTLDLDHIYLSNQIYQVQEFELQNYLVSLDIQDQLANITALIQQGFTDPYSNTTYVRTLADGSQYRVEKVYSYSEAAMILLLMGMVIVGCIDLVFNVTRRS